MHRQIRRLPRQLDVHRLRGARGERDRAGRERGGPALDPGDVVAGVHRDRLAQRGARKLDVVDRDRIARLEVGDVEGQPRDLPVEQLQLAGRLGPEIGIPAIAGVVQELAIALGGLDQPPGLALRSGEVEQRQDPRGELVRRLEPVVREAPLALADGVDALVVEPAREGDLGGGGGIGGLGASAGGRDAGGRDEDRRDQDPLFHGGDSCVSYRIRVRSVPSCRSRPRELQTRRWCWPSRRTAAW